MKPHAPTTNPKMVRPRLRTDRQNRALHLYLRQLSDALNEGGYSVKLVLAKHTDLDWNPQMVKELLWRPIQKAITKKESTTELKKAEEIDLIYETLNRHVAEKFGISLEFPHYENQQAYIEATSKT